jgi:hypothetical protein
MIEVQVLEVGNFVEATGTSLQGYVMATNAELEAVFGENLGPSDKVFNEFRGEIAVYDPELDCYDAYTVTLYDWKEASPYTARTGTYRWHVGGYNADAPYLVEDALEVYRKEQN